MSICHCETIPTKSGGEAISLNHRDCFLRPRYLGRAFRNDMESLKDISKLWLAVRWQ